MPNCLLCYQPITQTSALEAANDNIKPIYVLGDRQLLRRDYIGFLAQHIATVPVSSREVPNWMADIIYGFMGDILCFDNRPFEIRDEDIDQAFNNDGSFRWIRGFRQHANKPFKQIPQSRLLPRFRLISLAVQINLRNQARNDN